MTAPRLASKVPIMAKNTPSHARANRAAAGASQRSYALGGATHEAQSLAPGLYLVATPIGNLGDITLRALETLAAADVIACEDTRVTRRLTEHYGIATPLTPYHEHNAAEARPKLLARLAVGGTIALVSDAGTPLISDPGYKLARAASEAGHAVTALPGASAVLAALGVSGLPTDRFFFEGFLPPKQAARRKRAAVLATIPATLVIFETGPRIADALGDLAQCLGARNAAICRELTKLHEEVRRGTLDELARAYGDGAEIRGEFVVVISPPREELVADTDVDIMLHGALARVSVKDAVGEVALATGRSRREVYQRVLALTKDAGDG
jgi:16S rRNA (cytidine1402-2'-O)-methyltransferase